MLPALEVHIGDVYGRWTVIAGPIAMKWRCRCECGTVRDVPATPLKSGRSRSCGCLHRDEFVARITKHGDHQTRLYRIWQGMKHRCSYPHKAKHRNYHGRGIRVCDAWQTFPPFRDWALGHGYTDELSIDRIDNDGNYEPANCRWVTIAAQHLTQRHSNGRSNKPCERCGVLMIGVSNHRRWCDECR
jgi:hypothetical protein